MIVKFNYLFNEDRDYPWQHGLVSNEETPAIEDGALGKDDILKDLNLDDDEDKETVPEKEDNDEEVEEELDEEELEDPETKEEEEPTEEELELQTPVRIKEILAKYPNFKKEFPAVIAMYYKAKQYNEILPTIEDAKEAAESHKILDNFRGDLQKGDITRVLAAVKEQAPEEFPLLVDNYLSTLAKIDKDAYDLITHNVVANTFQFVYNKAKEKGSEDLKEAIEIISDYLFESKEVPNAIRASRNREDTSESDKLRKEREEFENTKFKDAIAEVDSRFNNQLKSTIELNIDRKNQMTPFVKRNAIRDVTEQLKKALEDDKSFKRYEDSLIKRAKAEKLSRQALDRIQSARITQAKNLLPKIISSVKAQALKGMSRRDEPTRFRRNTTSSETENRGDRGTKTNSKGYDDKGRKVRTLDFLNS